MQDLQMGPDAGEKVADVAACEAACDLEPGCNAASYYVPVIADTGKNCYLKALGDSCALPTDAITDPTATFSLKCATGAVAPAAVAPGAAPVAPASPGAPATTTPGPFAAPPESDDVDDETSSREFDAGTADAGAAVTDGSGAVGTVCTSIAAVAVAGVAALL